MIGVKRSFPPFSASVLCLFGQKTVEAIGDFRGWFADLFAKLAAIKRPAEAKQRQILERGNDWTRRQIELGHTVTTEQPPEVQAAIAKMNRESAMEC
jgi:hypothetical protein